jgi:phosphatidylglycerol---prolipoprotein diacylglyceryl transferase
LTQWAKPREFMSMFLATLPYPNLDPVLVQLGPFSIKWYGLAYIAALLFAWWGIARAVRTPSLWKEPPFNGKAPATEDQIGDLVVWCTLGVILGGRLGWDLIYGVGLCSVSPDAEFCRGLPYAFVTNPIKLIAAWQGGMSFHGGLLGVVIAVWLFCKKYKLKMLAIADLACAFAPLGLFFGRIANFVNGELWGRVTDVPWAMVFCNRQIRATYGGGCPAGMLPRHPSQLYEAALEGILLFIIVQVAFRMFRAQNRPGLISAIFFLGYGTFRFISEFFREPDAPFLGPISMGMALSIPVWVGAGLLFAVAFKIRK